MFDEGVIITIYGNPGSGKTDFGLSLLRFAPNKNIGINVKTDLKNAIIIHNDIELFNLFLKYRNNIIFFIDEAVLIANAKEALSKEAKNIDVLMAMIRKLRASAVWVIQRNELMNKTIRDLSSILIYKPTKDKSEWDIEGDVVIMDNIPGSKYMGIKYDTYSFAGFTFKLNLKKLFNKLAEMDEYEDSIKLLEEIASKDYWEYLLPVKDEPKQQKVTEEMINGHRTVVIDQRTNNKIATKKLVKKPLKLEFKG